MPFNSGTSQANKSEPILFCTSLVRISSHQLNKDIFQTTYF
jgi:hypothetical protein